MSQSSITRTLGRCHLWFLVAWGLAACGTSPSTTGDYQPAGPLAERVTQLETAGDYAGVAALYLSLEGDPRQRREWQLRAAEAYLRGNDPQRALDTVASLGNTPLNLEQKARYEMVVARAELLLGGPEAAAARLPAYSAALPAEPGIEVLQTRVEILDANGRFAEALLDRLTLDAVAVGQPALQDSNREALWALVQKMPDEELLTLISLEPELAGWVALRRAARVPLAERDEFDEQISNWWARFPKHVASERAQAIEEARAASQMPGQVALMLPLSGRYARVGAAIEEGFVAALETELSQPPLVRVYDTELGDLDVLYQLALREGSEIIVGPLLKERVAQLAQRQDLEIPILALNRIALEESPHETFFQFGLVPEDEARQIAVDALERGLTRALVLYPLERPEPPPPVESEAEAETEAQVESAAAADSANAEEPAPAPVARPLEWGERLRDGFIEPYTKAAGNVVGIQPFASDGADFTQPITALLQIDASSARHADLQRRLGRSLEFEPRRREDADFIFLAATADQARQVFPQLRFHRLGDLPVVATSNVYTGRPDPIRDRDLDGLQHLEIPWIVTRGETPLGRYVFPDSANTPQAELAEPSEPGMGELAEPSKPSMANLRPRLFALGADAYYLLPSLTALKISTGASLRGATGELTSDPEGRILRRLVWANFRNGLPVRAESGIDAAGDLGFEPESDQDADTGETLR